MLRLWRLPAASSLHRLLLYSTAAAAAKSAAPFVAEEYLVSTCGLTPAQALKSAKRLAHLKSSSKPDAVLAFLADFGLDKADVAAAIAKDPRLLCVKVNETLTPRSALLHDIGLSTPQISRLITIFPVIFCNPAQISRLRFYLSLLGSYDKVHTALRRNRCLLYRSLESVVKPNMTFLRHCGLSDYDITKIIVHAPGMMISDPEAVKKIVVCANLLGVPRNSGMFKGVLIAIFNIRAEKMHAKVDSLKKILDCSEAEVCIAVGKLPSIMCFAEDKLRRTMEFLKMEVGLNAAYIVHRPALLAYSMTTRVMPRHYVLKVLKEEGLLKKDADFYHVVSVTEKMFAKKFLDPYRLSAPGLADAYTAARAGQVPPVIQP